MAASDTILIAEDSPTQAEALRLILESEGFHAVVVEHGQAALEAALASPPDAVLADVTMPELDGISLCRALRADPRTAELPFVILTGLDDPPLGEGLVAGVDGWLRKPVDMGELIEGLRAVIARHRRRAAR